MNEETIFAQAAAMSAEERAAFLEEACQDNARLRARIEALLKAHDNPDDFLNAPAVDVAATEDSPRVTEGLGDQIGNYKLRQRIGEGGFGVVYMAEQLEPVRRMVALKIIKPGMDTREVIARFEAERQALALMDHPNIARVLDGGATESGRPYFVMELVKGVAITEYCDKNRLTTPERLDLFATVCNTVQHAHQKGIIHRDLKPSNIMVTLHDGRPVIKVIDFGVSKAINQQLTQKTLFTAYGQMVGTPQYMSPEQAEMSGLDVDTRSDIYSLGVLLYELLTGSPPLEANRLRSAGFAEMQRIICEEEPPRPSVRLSTAGEKLTIIAAHRQVTPDRLHRLIKGDLDWIVMKALDKDRTRRYPTADALADDIQRHLSQEPVAASSPSATYRFGKFVRRNKVALATATAVLLSLVLGLVGTSWQARRARLAARDAILQKEHAEQQRMEADRQAKAAIVASVEAKMARARADKRLYVADINQAWQAWFGGNLTEARSLLLSHEPKGSETDFRGLEWYMLWNQCLPGLHTEKTPTSDFPLDVVYSPKGSFIATCQDDGVVSVFTHDFRPIRNLKLSFNHAPWERYFVSFSADEEWILHPGDNRHSIILKNLETNLDRRVTQGVANISYAIFSQVPSRSYLAIADDAGKVTVRDWQSDAVIFSHEDAHPVNKVAFSQDATLVAWSSGHKWLTVCNIKTNRVILQDRIAPSEGKGLHEIAFSPDSRLIVTADDREIHVWDVGTGRKLAILSGHDGFVHAVHFLQNGFLVSGGRDNIIKIWDMNSFRECKTLRGHSAYVIAIATHPSQNLFVSAGLDNRLIKWDLDSARTLDEISAAETLQIRQLGVTADGSLLASLQLTAGQVQLWNLISGTSRGTIDFGVELRAFDISCDDKLAAGGDGSVFLHDLRTGDQELLDNTSFFVNSVGFSPDGKSLVAGGGKHREGEQGDTIVWDLETKERRVLRTGDSSINWVEWSPDGNMLAAAGMQDVYVWDVRAWRLRHKLQGHTAEVACVRFSPDGRTVASCGRDSTIRLWNVRTGENDCTILTHSGFVWEIAFTRDGKKLISASGDDTVAIWDVEDRSLLARFLGHKNGCKAIALTEDEQYLVTGGLYDGKIRIWRTSRVSLPDGI